MTADRSARVLLPRRLTIAVLLGLVTGAAGVLALGAQSAAAATPCGTSGSFSLSSSVASCTYTQAGADNFTVPSGVTSATFTVDGAQGGGFFGGEGGEVSATLTVQAPQLFAIDVGVGGGSAGERSGGSGGGYSAVTDASTQTLKLLAGGGGGAGQGDFGGGDGAAGGVGGAGTDGQPGADRGTSSTTCTPPPLSFCIIQSANAGGGGGGKGGADVANPGEGGAAGVAVGSVCGLPQQPGLAGDSGTGYSGTPPFHGGAGADGNTQVVNEASSIVGKGGGGGGGGYVGGGGGGSGGTCSTFIYRGGGGGGGGGSSYVDPSLSPAPVISDGAHSGSAQVTVSWNVTPTSTTVSAPASATQNTAIAPSSITSTLSGGTSPTGAITFTVFGPQESAPTDCTSGGQTVDTASVSSGDGTYSSSTGFTPTAAGTYWWYASYGGDGSNGISDSGCGAGMINTVVTPGDSTPPEISYTLTPASPGAGGWYNTPVALDWTVSDPESPSSVTPTGCQDTTVNSEQKLTEYSCAATSAGGTAAPVKVSLGYDTHAPTFTPSLSPLTVLALGAPAPAVTLGNLADPDPDGNGPIEPSGVDSASSACGTIATGTIGKWSVSCTARDNAANETTTPVGYYVSYAFAGFQSPLPKSTQKKSSTIPVKFKLANHAGTTSFPNVSSIRAQITGPATATAACPYDATIAAYKCTLKLPNKAGGYVLTVQQQLGGDWVALANTAGVAGKPNANGEAITLN